MKSNNKRKLPKVEKTVLPQDVAETSITIKLDDELKNAFLAALETGRPSTYTHALQGLMRAYIDATKREGRQPEFPLEVRQKEPKGS